MRTLRTKRETKEKTDIEEREQKRVSGQKTREIKKGNFFSKKR